MDNLNFNKLLNRESIVNSIKCLLNDFDKNKTDLTYKRGIYIYGAPGSGKTELIVRLLKSMNYDVVKYDAGDIRNKSIIDTITNHNMSDKSVLSLMQKKSKQIAIIMDEIDGMNNGDKGGINSLIKLIRPKKTKKQKSEYWSNMIKYNDPNYGSPDPQWPTYGNNQAYMKFNTNGFQIGFMNKENANKCYNQE